MEDDPPMKSFSFPSLTLSSGGSNHAARLSFCSPMLCCSCFLSLLFLVMGCTLTTVFFKSNFQDDPVVGSMKTSGVVFLIIGIVLSLSTLILFITLCYFRQLEPKTSSAAKANVPYVQNDPLSLAPSYPPCPAPVANPYFTSTIEGTYSEDPTVLPGSVLSIHESISPTDSGRSTPQNDVDISFFLDHTQGYMRCCSPRI